VLVEAERNNPSADLLAAWLRNRLNLEVARRLSHGPGITAVRLGTAAGDIAITRPDGLLASYTVPGQPERLVALKRREVTELISEELRRMDPDDVYESTVKSIVGPPQSKMATTKKRTTTKRAAKKPAVKKPATKRAGKKAAAGRARG